MTNKQSKVKTSQVKMCAFNKKLKAPDQMIDYTPEQLQDYIECKKSVVTFAERHCKIVTIDGGLQKMELWDFQKEILQEMQDGRFIAMNGSRQCSKSQIFSIFCCWYLIFHDYKKIAIMAHKLGAIKEVLNQKIKICFENLPVHITQGVTVWNVNSFELENHSSIGIYATTESSVRGLTCNILVLDEVAIIREKLYEEFSRSSFPVISSGQTSKIFLFSTPKGMGNHWHEIVTKAKMKKSIFKLFEIPWYRIPGRTQKWFDDEKSMYGDDYVQQEYCCAFIGTSNSLIKGSVLTELINNIHQNEYSIEIKDEPLFDQLEKYHNNIKIFKLPRPGRLYISSVDSATNTDEESGDGACLQMLDITELPFEQVAVADFIDDTSYLEIPYVQVELARIYNNAVIFNENNCGASRENNRTLVSEIGYENIFWENSKISGYRTTTISKSRGCQNLKQLIERGYLKLYDNTTVNQLFQFAKKNNSYEANEGHHDDSIMALIGAIFFLQLSQERIEEVFTDPDCYYRLPSIVDLLKIIYTTRYEAIEEAVEITADGANFQNKLLNQRQGQSLNALIESGMDDPLTLLRAQERMRSAVTTMRGAEYDQDDDDDFTFLGVDDSAKKRKRTIDDLIF